jgi:hypothetical protein
MVGGRALQTPSYPNWQRNWTQNPDSVGSNPTEGTIVMSEDIGMAPNLHHGSELFIRAAEQVRWRVLHGASQAVREQSGELCRILGYVAFGEKGCAVK